jgi:hypothetical protein
MTQQLLHQAMTWQSTLIHIVADNNVPEYNMKTTLAK